ncbi:NAD(P)H-binding protein [Massilia glaciei]|uniref:Epimerase n=1 Tax=Massilia glaciei TaxID=1524097 RepID=A0A2U2HN94_9BURK|nr:NAD(P)H-binding protein [Massilia glaciei]PWF48988.1 epimerase [Massilia glaciei]
MNVLIFGASGMVGQGALREALAARDVALVKTVGRSPNGQQHPKLRDLVLDDMWDYSEVEDELRDFDACFFCLGTSSSGKKEAEYTRTTYELTLAAATTLVRLNPQMVFVYVSAAGADTSEKGKLMWARVRGKTENALLQLPFRGVYMFRPGMIEPLDGIKSKTAAYRVFYSLTKPVLPLLRKLMPAHVLSTAIIGQAMLAAVRHGAPKRILETGDINALGGGAKK